MKLFETGYIDDDHPEIVSFSLAEDRAWYKGDMACGL
jgi:hypothetical protein